MLTDKILLALCCLTGEEGKDFMFYKTLDDLANKIGMSSPYRNPDKTLACLIMNEWR